MDILQLSAFLAVAHNKSFSAAAENLYLTQPAISKRIAQLESQLGTRLFDRIGKAVSLTEAGETLLPRATTILRELQDAERAVRDLSGEISGALSLATSHHIGLHRLPAVLREFTNLYPAVSLDIAFMDSELANEAVLHGRIELGIITLPPQTPPQQLETHVVWPDPLVVMVAQDHPLSDSESVELSVLAQHAAVLPGQGTYTGQILSRLFSIQELDLQINMTTNYLETLRMLASIGLGWSVLPESMLTGDLKKLDIEGIELQRQLGYIYHRERTLSNAAQAFIALLEEFKATT